MILHLSKSTDAKLVEEIVDNYDAFHILQEDKHVVITSSSVKEVDEKYQDAITESFVFKTDIQLASNEYLSSNREIHFGDISIGGNTNKRGGRRKRFFKITETGIKQLKAAQDVRQKMWELIPQFKFGM